MSNYLRNKFNIWSNKNVSLKNNIQLCQSFLPSNILSDAFYPRVEAVRRGRKGRNGRKGRKGGKGGRAGPKTGRKAVGRGKAARRAGKKGKVGRQRQASKQ